MKRLYRLLCLCTALLLFCGCAAKTPAASPEESLLTFTDDLGREVMVYRAERVVCLYGSYAEAWLLAGGSLAGATSDAVEERGLELGEAQVIGSVKSPELERILALEPDLVLLSADIAAQVELDDALTLANVPHAYFRVDHYTQYLNMMSLFCSLTGEEAPLEQAQAMAEEIDALLAGLPEEGPSVLLVRAYSTGAKSKGSDSLCGWMLKDLNCRNLVDSYPSLLEELSIEAIIQADPDFIFVTTMGQDSEKAIQALADSIGSDPAWAGLSAVKNGRFITLPQALFHYKPNARWEESYAYLKDILYP